MEDLEKIGIFERTIHNWFFRIVMGIMLIFHPSLQIFQKGSFWPVPIIFITVLSIVLVPLIIWNENAILRRKTKRNHLLIVRVLNKRYPDAMAMHYSPKGRRIKRISFCTFNYYVIEYLIKIDGEKLKCLQDAFDLALNKSGISQRNVNSRQIRNLRCSVLQDYNAREHRIREQKRQIEAKRIAEEENKKKQEQERKEQERRNRLFAYAVQNSFPYAYRLTLGLPTEEDKLDGYIPKATLSAAEHSLEYIEKNRLLTVFKPSVSKEQIELIASHPFSYYDEIEAKASETYKQKKLKIEQEYRELENRYPNGVRLFIREHKELSNKERIVTLSPEIFISYEDNYQRSQEYSLWKESQAALNKKVRELHNTILPNWGLYNYSSPVSGFDEFGKPTSLDFTVCQFFCEAFCASDDVDYSFCPSYVTNRESVSGLLKGTIQYKKEVYEKVLSLILALPREPLVLFADSGIGERWQSVEDLHFETFKHELLSNGIKYGALKDVRNSIFNQKSVVLFELISNNDRLKENCSSCFNRMIGSRPTIIYFSLLKEYDLGEVKDVIQRRQLAKKEAEEKARKERLEKELLIMREQERIRKEESERRAREERERLFFLSHKKKEDAPVIRDYLASHKVNCFYHFTDIRNIESIKKAGGLYSWQYCMNHSIDVLYPGGGSQSRSLDSYHGLQDYVRLSFCDDHPMAYRLKESGYKLVLLRIKIDVALLAGTLFSDINAADSAHHHGGSLEDLKRVDIDATQQHYVKNSSTIFKKHQAEVMVKTFIPIEYIENINSPAYL